MKIKLLTAFFILTFFSFTTALMVGAIVNHYYQKDNKLAKEKIQDAKDKLANGQSQALIMEAIAKHNKESDCWLLIDGNVYDVTSFISQHPGGGGTMVPYCGKEASKAFENRGENSGESHSAFARNLLRNYYLGPLGKNPEKISVPNASKSNTAQTSSSNSNSVGSSSLVVDAAEVAKHSSLSNCWMILSGKVYNITSFISQHPGGQASIAPYCGKDGTSAFQSKGGQGSNHSSFAYSLLSNYFIANFGSSVTIATANSNPSNVVIPTSAPVNNNTPTSNLSLTTAEVATHNTLQNCWMIISGNVYDFTRFISQHPGGATAITNYCGKDGSSAYQTKGGKGSNHSSYAYSLLGNYIIGTLGQSVSVGNPGTNPAPTSTGTSNTGGSSSSGIPQAISSKYPGSSVISGKYEDNGIWEGKVNTSSGCRAIKVNSSGSISEDQSC